MSQGGVSKQVESVLAWWRPRLRILRRVGRVVSASHITRMAAALSYRTVFGLIPMLAIGVAVLGGFATDKQVTDAVTNVLELTGLDEIAVAPETTSNTGAGSEQPSDDGAVTTGDGTALGDGGGDSATAADAARDGPGAGGPDGVDAGTGTGPDASLEATALGEWLNELVSKVRGVSFVAIGLTGLLILAYAAISFMVEIERSVNQIYRAPTGRSWVRRVTQYWTTLTLGSLFLFGTFYVGEQMTDWVDTFSTPTQKQVENAAGGETGLAKGDIAEGQPSGTAAGEPGLGADDVGGGGASDAGDGKSADESPPVEGDEESKDEEKKSTPNFWAQSAGTGVNILINFVLLFFVYMTVPNARVALKSAAGGAILAATVWELGKWGFKFLAMNSSAQTLYGALALVPLFLLWVYITWIIVLSGLQLAYMFQHFRAFAVEEEADNGPLLIDPLALVRVAAEVARGFAIGQSATVSGVSTAIGLDEKASLEMLERLSKAGFLHEVPLGQGREGFTLARPAEKVRARELLELASQVSAGGRVSAEDGKLGELRRAQLDAAADLSLADLAGSSGVTSSPGATEPAAGLAASS